MTAVILLLLLLAGLVAGLIAFLSFRNEVRQSNRRVPTAAQRALAQSNDVESEPQLVLIVFDRASLFARTDPDRGVVSLLSVPSSAYVPAHGRTTVEKILRDGGAAGLVRFARSALDLPVAHIALLRPHDIGPLVDAIGGVRIQDPSLGIGAPSLFGGTGAERYLESAGPLGSGMRRERERAMLEAIITRLAEVASFSRLPHLARTFSTTIATDLSPRDTLALALVRLRSKLSIQCALPEGTALEWPRLKGVLRQFLGVAPPPPTQAGVFPSKGCRATKLSAPLPRALIFFGEHALALFPFVPELAGLAIALDLLLLLMLVGAPQALIRVWKERPLTRQRPSGAGLGEPRPKHPVTSQSLSEALGNRVANHTASPETSATPASPERSGTPARPETRAAPAEAVQVRPQVGVALDRLVDDVLPPVREGTAIEAEKTEANATLGKARSSASEAEPERLRTKASELFRASGRPIAAVHRRLSRGGFGKHADLGWLFAATLGKARSSASEAEPERLRTKASELFWASGRPIAAVHRRLSRRAFGKHTDVAWPLAGATVAIVLGYLIGHL
jgi:anionic cell wall polymer biosynthesis LytR-Cps2A-Psr (LCP) family protein